MVKKNSGSRDFTDEKLNYIALETKMTIDVVK